MYYARKDIVDFICIMDNQYDKCFLLKELINLVDKATRKYLWFFHPIRLDHVLSPFGVLIGWVLSETSISQIGLARGASLMFLVAFATFCPYLVLVFPQPSALSSAFSLIKSLNV